MKTRPPRGPLLPILAGVLIAALAAPLGALPGPVAQEPAPEQDDPEAKKEPEKAKAWPAVDKAAVKVEIDRLRKARTPEMGEQAHAALIALGPGAAPFVLDKLPHEQDPKALARMQAVLEKITDARHTRVLAERFAHRSPQVRVWCLERVAGYPDPGVRPAAEKALAAAQGRKRKLDPAEVLAAALCCASSGSFEGFEQVCAAAEEDWGERREAIGTALGPLRSPEATARLAPLLEESSRKRKLVGLRLLAACGHEKTAVALVRPFLDDSDNSLRVGAINALRGIVDGDPPLPRLPVFEAIERANKWKARL